MGFDSIWLRLDFDISFLHDRNCTMNTTEKPYISSIIKLYGDTENVKRDVKTLREIFDRQGQDLLLDVVAEKIGEICLDYKFTNSDKAMTKIAAVDHLENAINERI